MANVARLDARLRREFARTFFMKHPYAILTDANGEMRKKFRMGMSSNQLGRIRAQVQREKFADKASETKPLRVRKENNIPDFVKEHREEKEALVAEVQRRTDDLAELLKNPKCPVFGVFITRNPDGVQSSIKRLSTATDTKKY